MLGWLRELLRKTPRPSRWSVRIEDNVIVTSDGRGTEKRLPVVNLRKVVVATDDSGPRGDDVMYLLFADLDDTQPNGLAGLFPLEAGGCDDFVAWLSQMPGYEDKELSRAMASTRVARFVIFEATS